MALPVLLETGANLQASVGLAAGLQVPGSSGTEAHLEIVQCTGLTSTYTRALKANLTGVFLAAKWAHHRIGGAGPAEILVRGGIADLDTAVQNEWEVELKRGGTAAANVWYRGRIVGYRYESAGDKDAAVNTRIYCEGYLTKLAQLKIDKDYAASTVKVIVTDILDTYVTPNTRIAYTAADIVGAFVATSLSFKGRTVLEALEMLGMLQGSTEWGVSEGSPKPQFWFKAEGTGTSESQVFQLGKDVTRITAEGSFDQGYSTFKVVGGWTAAGAVITGSYTDGAAQTLYGKREKVIHDSAILHADDAVRLATNYAAVYANGIARYHVSASGPTSRIEPDRTAGTPIGVAKKATFRGIDGAQVTDFFNFIEYDYISKSPTRLTAAVQAGLPDDCVQQVFSRLSRTVESLVQQSQQFSQGAGGGSHTVLSATHTDTTAAALVAGDLLYAAVATALLTRLPIGVGNAGKFLRSTTVVPEWSAWTLPASVSAHAFLYASAANTVGEITTNNDSVLITGATGIPAFSTDLPSVTTKGGTAIAGTGANTYTGAQTLSGAPTADLHAATKLYSETLGGSVALTDAAPTSLDPTLGTRFTHTATANRTVNFTVGTPDGKRITYEVKSDSAVARIITFGTNVKSTGVLTTPASSTLVVSATFESDGTNYKELTRQIAGL